MNTTADNLLSPGPVSRIRVDLTTRCNLRCVYCALSQFSWHGQDMPADLAQRATKAACRYPPILQETLFRRAR